MENVTMESIKEQVKIVMEESGDVSVLKDISNLEFPSVMLKDGNVVSLGDVLIETERSISYVITSINSKHDIFSGATTTYMDIAPISCILCEERENWTISQVETLSGLELSKKSDGGNFIACEVARVLKLLSVTKK